MTLQEALENAARAKPKQPERIAFNKLQASTIAERLTAGAAALNKRHSGMSGTITDIQKELDRARAGVALFADAFKINLTETMQ